MFRFIVAVLLLAVAVAFTSNGKKIYIKIITNYNILNIYSANIKYFYYIYSYQYH